MTRSEKLALLTDIVKRHDALEAAQKPLRELGMSLEAPCMEEPWRVMDFAIGQVAARIGDKGGWCGWFIHENDCGRKGLEAGLVGKERPIRTVEDLLWVMEVGK